MSKTNTFLNMVEAAADWVAERFGRAENTVDDPVTNAGGERLEDDAVNDWEDPTEKENVMFPGVPPVSENYTPRGAYFWDD